jgi:hypothetical protein
MADYNSHAAAPTNLVLGRFFKALSNRKTQSSTAPKTPSNNLAVGLVKILRKRRKGHRETASNHRAAQRHPDQEPNLGSVDRTGPYLVPDPTQIRWWTASNRVDVDPAQIHWWTAPNRVSTRSATRGSGFWASSGLGVPVLLILVIVSVLFGISWRFSNGLSAKSLAGSQTGWALRAIPLVLTLILHCLSSSEISKTKSEILAQVFQAVSASLSRKCR